MNRNSTIAMWLSVDRVFPAQAGMNRSIRMTCETLQGRCVPRAGGDEPTLADGVAWIGSEVFPAQAGMNRGTPQTTIAPLRRVFPAQAGMNRCGRSAATLDQGPGGVPHAGGDEPAARTAVVSIGDAVFPAQAGMNRRN